jgi:hypothetical protein
VAVFLPFRTRAPKSLLSTRRQNLISTIQNQETPFGFSRSSALRFQETHRDIFGSRAALQAAFIARSQGAVYAVMVGFDNEGDVVRTSLNGNKVEVTLRLKGRASASIVDPTSAEVLATFESSEVDAEQHEVVTLALPEGITPLDPRARPFIEQGVEIAQPLSDALMRLVSVTSLAVREPKIRDRELN